MINEKMDAAVDWLTERVPRWFRYITVVHKQPGSFCWHFRHFTRSVRKLIGAVIAYCFKPVDQQEFDEKPGGSVKEILYSVFFRLNGLARGLELPGAFVLVLYAVAMTAAVGTGSAAMAAVSTMLLWASRVVIHTDPGGRFYFADLGQVYIISVILRLLALLGTMMYFLTRYVGIFLLSNVLLQGMLLLTTVIHLVLFFILIFPGFRRNRVLTMLSFVQGFGGAMMLASAVCAATSTIRAGLQPAAGGVIAACGAVMVFFGDRLLDCTEIGGIRLFYPYLWKTLLFIGGWLIMLMGMWLGA